MLQYVYVMRSDQNSIINSILSFALWLEVWSFFCLFVQTMCSRCQQYYKLNTVLVLLMGCLTQPSQ